ncbi:MAG: agmatine deiminase family protein [Saprospiraceae bacterium]
MTQRYLFLFCLLTSGLFAQHPTTFLPRHQAVTEPNGYLSAPPDGPFSSAIVTPPVLPVRAMAEWEELQALLITWNGQSTILSEIVRAARLECKVIICCASESIITSAKNTLTSKGVDFSSNVTFLVVPNDSIWIRDYGPNCVYANDVDSLYLIDWIYNRPRPKDDLVPEKIANYLGVPLYSTTEAPYTLVNTGGNFMSDGMGTAFSSELIYADNGPDPLYQLGQGVQTEAEVKAILHDFMGIDRYINMEPLPYDGIHHIDMHMKLLDEETLLIGQYPPNTADGPQIEANLQYVLSNYPTPFGTPYKVIRIPMPADGNGDYPDDGGQYRTYANAVFVNKTVILPFYEQKFDTTAQRIWEESLPGYHIVGINCNSIIGSKGAIHCITKEIGVADPLRIVPEPILGLACGGQQVKATISHRSGIASARFHYTIDQGSSWEEIEMTPSLDPNTPDLWTTWLSYQPTVNSLPVYYYFDATAQNGKQAVRPLPAPEGYWKVMLAPCVATEEAPTATLLDIYPNPAHAITCIPVSTTDKTLASIRVFNTLGQQITTLFAGELPAGTSNYFLDASQYVPGTYFVQLQTSLQTVLKKLAIR